MGLPPETIDTSLASERHDHITTTYLLLLRRRSPHRPAADSQTLHDVTPPPPPPPSVPSAASAHEASLGMAGHGPGHHAPGSSGGAEGLPGPLCRAASLPGAPDTSEGVSSHATAAGGGV